MCNKGYSTWFVCLCVSVTMFSTTRCNQTAKKLYKQTDLALDLKLALFVMNVTVTLAAHARRGLKTVHSKVSEHANNNMHNSMAYLNLDSARVVRCQGVGQACVVT